MIDRIFSAALTFCLLVAGTLAIGSALFGQDGRANRETQVIELPTVHVIGQRTAYTAQGSASKVADARATGDCVDTVKTIAPRAAENGKLANI